MLCNKCKSEFADEYAFCPHCGYKVNKPAKRKKSKTRGNSQGTAYKASNGKWVAEVTLGYETITLEDGTVKFQRRKATKHGFDTKKDALEFLPQLRMRIKPLRNPNISFTELYKEWLPQYEAKVSKETMDCYRAAYKYFKPIYFIDFKDLKTDNLQVCIDQCSKGRRTKENMKALCGLLYKYAMQIDLVDKNYAQFIYIPKEEKTEKIAFSENERNMLWDNIETTKGIDLILTLCYTGLRPGELLSAKTVNYHPEEGYFIAGSKTAAGKERIITISPKIKPFFESYGKGEYLFSYDGKKITDKHFREHIFYPALTNIGIDVGEKGNRRLTPHCCRHTFATLMKDINAPNTDKQKLIGHSKFEMTAYYTHTDLESLKNITDNLA